MAAHASTARETSPSASRRWIGRVLSALAASFLVFDGAIKVMKIQPVTEGFARLGYPDHLARTIGALQLSLVVLYLVPRTAAFGAVLLTGFLGGAISTHVRVLDPLVSHVLFPTYIGAMMWIGLYLRDARVRRLVAARATEHEPAEVSGSV
jgi:hypothetical protein